MSLRTRIGVMVPSTNTTFEADFQLLAPSDVTVHGQRLWLTNDAGGAAGMDRMNAEVESGARYLATAVDLVRVLFFGAAIVLTAQMMQRIGGNVRMTVVDLPMNVVYGMCLLAFVVMFVRSLQVAWIHWRRGYTVLERPELALEA